MQPWNSTLLHRDDLPFTPGSCPRMFTQFRKQCESKWKVRDLVHSPPLLLPFPRHQLGNFQIDEVDEKLLTQALDNFPSSVSEGGVHLKGGETEALSRVNHFVWNDFISKYKDTRNSPIGIDTSSKFSAYLALGCLSPRKAYWEIQEYEKRRVANDSTYWLIFELLWRDFFKFLCADIGDSVFLEYGVDSPSSNLTSSKSSSMVNSTISPHSATWSHNKLSFQRWVDGATGIPW